MARSPAMAASIISTRMPERASAFGDFLYATIGDDSNGMALTVLSALARQDVDPWQEAADLSRLPRGSAIQRITSRLETIPGAASLEERTAIAERLLSLLPAARPLPAPPRQPDAGLAAGMKLISSSELSVVIIYVVLMCFGGRLIRFRCDNRDRVSRSTVASLESNTPVPHRNGTKISSHLSLLQMRV
jgi:hypothetical protein